LDPTLCWVQPMTEGPTKALNDLADKVVDEFEEYRPADEGNQVSPIVDNENPDRPT